jgi:dihydrofolate synthase/folylpolyglutamate synthase
LCHRVIITKPTINRALEPDILLHTASGMVDNCTIIENVRDAVSYAVQTENADGVVCVAGSLYVVGEAKATFPAISQCRH